MSLSEKEQLVLDELIQKGRANFSESMMKGKGVTISLNIILEDNAFRVENNYPINGQGFLNGEMSSLLDTLEEIGKIDKFEQQAKTLYKVDLKEKHLDYDNTL